MSYLIALLVSYVFVGVVYMTREYPEQRNERMKRLGAMLNALATIGAIVFHGVAAVIAPTHMMKFIVALSCGIAVTIIITTTSNYRNDLDDLD